MPNKGSGWRWYDVEVTDADGTVRQVEITAVCNGTYVNVSYTQKDPTGSVYSYPDGSVTNASFSGGCTESVVRAVAVEHYAQRTGGL